MRATEMYATIYNYDKHHKAWQSICGAFLLFAQNYYYCNNQGKCYDSYSY